MTDTTPPSPAEKTALAPDLRAVDDRTARAWTERMAVRQLPDGRYAVDSQSDATYVVDLSGECTCPDHSIRGEHCKHLRRVAVEVTAGRVPAPHERAASCGACGRETFVGADADPPALCESCRLEPGDRVVDRETGDQLLVYRVLDRRAGDVWIDAADATVADYPTNSAYPDDDLVVEAVYPADSAAVEGDADRASDSPRRYAFPHSRLTGHAVRPEDGDRRPREDREGSSPPLAPG